MQYLGLLVAIVTTIAASIAIYIFVESRLHKIGVLPKSYLPLISLGTVVITIGLLMLVLSPLLPGQIKISNPFGNTPQTSLTSALTPIPTDTPTPQLSPTPSPSPTSQPKPGTVLYQASTLSDWNSWALSADWKVISYNSLLISDGTANSFGGGPTAVPPYSLQGLLNFAVEATIESGTQHIDESSFGIVACGSIYRAGIDYRYGPGAVILYPNNEDIFNPNATGSFDPGTAWHTYRLEVRGNTLKLLIDGAPIVNAIDGTYASCDNQVGLWGSRITLQVKSFKIVEL